MNFISNIRQAITYYKSLIKICNSERQHIPKARLVSCVKNGTKYYGKIEAGKYSYLGKRGKEVEDLTRRRFYDKCSDKLRKNLIHCVRAVRGIEDFDPYKIAKCLGKSYSDVPDSCFSKLGFEPPARGDKIESKLDYHNESKRHISAAGVAMRSKSEVLISNIYAAHSLEPIYEAPLYLPNGGVLYPDFTITKKDGSGKVYHEHCGMMTDQEYKRRFFYKLDEYLRFGYIPFKDVLFTFDDKDGNIDVLEIDRMISFYFGEQGMFS